MKINQDLVTKTFQCRNGTSGLYHDPGDVVGVEPDEDEENIPQPPPRVGVKVVVKDGDGIPWEIELDPDYHSQLIQDIESQIPEKSEGGSVRYSLEYDSKKIWSVKKLEDK